MQVLHQHILRPLVVLRHNRCGALLAALCIFILVNPFLAQTAVGKVSSSIGVLLVMVLAVWAIRARRLVLLAALVFTLLAIESIVSQRINSTIPGAILNGGTALFIGVVTVALLRYVLDWHAITINKVFAAVSAYVLIAFSFASLFTLLELVQGKSFYVALVNDPDGRLGWHDMMYFSFTVLTSTGFGEITPINNAARSLIVIEQVLGVMYVAFLVARLANLYGKSGH